MARLPDALGTPDQLGVVARDASRLIPHYEGGQVGEATQRFGDIAGQAANQIQDTQDRLGRAAAEQDFISRKLDIDQQFASDGDYSTAPQRYRQALFQALNDTSQGGALGQSDSGPVIVPDDRGILDKTSDRLLPVLPNGKAKVAVVELGRDGNSYRIVTAGVRSPDKLPGEPLWRR